MVKGSIMSRNMSMSRLRLSITNYVGGILPLGLSSYLVGGKLTKSAFVDQFVTILRNFGVHALQFAGQSFQIGAATTAAMVGID